MSPPDNAVVLCIDEKSQIRRLNELSQFFRWNLGQTRASHARLRPTWDGRTCSLRSTFATGKVIGKCYQQHRAKDLRAFLREVEKAVPLDLEVHAILDNLSAHKAPTIKRWLAQNPRFHSHFTPTHASWLNLVERFFGLLTEHALRRGSHTSTVQLRAAINEYLAAHNEAPKPFKWTKNADEILESIARFATSTLTRTAGRDFVGNSEIRGTSRPTSASAKP